MISDNRTFARIVGLESLATVYYSSFNKREFQLYVESWCIIIQKE